MGGTLAGAGLRGLRFSPDGSRVTWLQGAADDKDRLDLWAYDLGTRRAARLVDSRALVPQETALSAEEEARRERARTAALRGIIEYSFSADGRRLLFPLAGDLYLYDLSVPEAQAVRRLTRSDAWETDAKFSPQGHFVSFIRQQDLWVVDLASGEERAITSGGGGLISHGVAEFIAQEELGRDTGYWWSPDESAIAYADVDETPVPEVERVEILGNGTRTVRQRYPAAGQPNALVGGHIGFSGRHGAIRSRSTWARIAMAISRGSIGRRTVDPCWSSDWSATSRVSTCFAPTGARAARPSSSRNPARLGWSCTISCDPCAMAVSCGPRSALVSSIFIATMRPGSLLPR